MQIGILAKGFSKMKLLFICNLNRQRSPTGKKVFEKEHETESAGIYATPQKIMERLLEWADIIFVMEEQQRMFLSENFQKLYPRKKIINLGIPDTYFYMDDGLVDILKKKVIAELKK